MSLQLLHHAKFPTNSFVQRNGLSRDAYHFVPAKMGIELDVDPRN